MRVRLKYKTKRGGWAFARCDGCNSKIDFKSFAAAESWAVQNGHRDWKATRLRPTER